ncbi:MULTISPECIES: helix-turn-helix domain-containing protein [Comamonas]|uniref:Transcriptional regulator n=1 Tax=Comamonas flocculans TaxID=2597701 RepID=A0A5B8RSJ1_9BURK|nr:MULTISPECIES: transcriptional regulator [Comamonas]QEA11808.1 transcriptional regulator [Comamonas flocculans]QXL84898.1 transcriptional regulator [Comamonas sp. NLF-1-9]
MSQHTLHPIRTEDDYRAALKTAESFFDAPDECDPASEEGAWFEALLTLIEAWERKHYPLKPLDPVDAIKFHMDQAGLTVADMAPWIGPRHRVYEILGGKRPLTLHMIRRLLALGIPAQTLVGKPEPAMG